jgi:putative chitinase
MNVKIKFGDTLTDLARKFKTSVSDLAKANGISNPNRIFAGNDLKLPGDASKANGSSRYQSYQGASGAKGATAAGSPPPMPADFPLKLDPGEVARSLGVPEENVRQYLPHIVNAMAEKGITDPNAVIGILATIKTEVPNFAPIEEYASGAAYEGRGDLGNTQPGDGMRFKGRGFIQLTGRANYEEYGRKLGVDLVGNPDLALDPKISAKIMVEYFAERGVDNKAAAGNWEGVRRAVNGGMNGWDTFIAAVGDLRSSLA